MKKLINHLINFTATVCKVLSFIMVILLMLMSIIMFVQITSRVVFKTGFAWIEELSRYSFIWMCFLGIPVAFYYNDFSRFDLLQEKFKANTLKTSLTIIDIVLIGIMVIMTTGAIPLVQRQMGQLATTLPIPMGIVYIAIPIGGVISIFILSLKILLRWVENRDFVLEEETK